MRTRKLVTLMTVGLCAAIVVSQQRIAKTALVKTGDWGSHLAAVSRGGNVVADFPSRGGVVGGRWRAPRLFLQDGEGGGLSIWQEGKEGTLSIAAQATQPQWSPDGSRLLYGVPGGGVRIFLTSIIGGQPEEVDATASAACFSPDGGRIAFTNPEGLWVVNTTLERPRKVREGIVATSMAWAPDGRTIAFIDPGIGKLSKPTLYTIRPNGSGLKKCRNLDQGRLTFSPDGKRIATSKGIVDLTNDGFIPFPTGLSSIPRWTGATELSALQGTELVTMRVSGPSATILADKVAVPQLKGAITFDQVRETSLSNALLVQDPFAGAPKPGPQQAVFEGTVSEIDPIEETFILQTQVVRYADGRELHLAKPAEQEVQATNQTARFVEGTRGTFRMINLKHDDEVSIVVDTVGLNPSIRPNVASVFILGDRLEVPALKGKVPRPKGPLEYDGVSREHVVVPMTFPMVGKPGLNDWFLAPRSNGRRHHGQDLMIKRMTPLVAVFDGTISIARGRGSAGYSAKIKGDNGWTANYYHLNNDNPNSDDGSCTDEFTFAPGVKSGQRVFEGQFIGYVGDSGNAETTAPHLHFELWDRTINGVANAYPSLKAAKRLEEPKIIDPFPSLKPFADESRVDGFVRTVDKTKRALQLSLTAKFERGKLRAVTSPLRAWVKVSDRTALNFNGNSNLSLKLDEVRTGLASAVIGKEPTKGQALEARLGTFGRID